MGTGLHGDSGLEPDTSINLLQSYVIHILVYGLEVVLPKSVHLNKLDKFERNLLSKLPQTVADPVRYIIAGALPVEAIIHPEHWACMVASLALTRHRLKVSWL